MVSTETLLLVLLSTGLLIVLVLAAAVLWVVLTILFRFRHLLRQTNSTKDLGSLLAARSEALLQRAERLKTELKEAAGDLSDTKDQNLADIQPLVGEGDKVMEELEEATKKLAGH